MMNARQILLSLGGAGLMAGALCLAAATGPAATASANSGRTYDQYLESLDQQIEFYSDRAASYESRWLPLQQLGDLYTRRATLTGSFDDLAAAQTALHEAFERAPEGTGPFLSQAALDFKLHRLSRAQQQLETARSSAIGPDDNLRAAYVGLAADIDLQSGRYARAREGFEQAIRLHETTQARARLANWFRQVGDAQEAEAQFDLAEGLVHGDQPDVLAWLHLQRGLLDLEAGQLEQALAHYQLADDHLPGWWLIEEHIAEIYVGLGQIEQARIIYLDVIERTGEPELMVCLAELEGGSSGSRWIARAAAAHEARLDRFREAALGHALEFFLAHEPDVQRVVALAQENHRLRPGGEASVLLAQAYLRAGDRARAEETVKAVVAGPFRSADLTTVAAEMGIVP